VHAIVRRPGELPMLLRTALDALIGFAALLHCRQLLGPDLGVPSLKQFGSGPIQRVMVPTCGYLEHS
jgi:adenosylhomocysteine nucleosidase